MAAKKPSKSKSPQKPKAGRPTKYKPEYCDQVRKLCLLGATDPEIADFFEVNVDTLYEWRKVYPAFSEAIKEGKSLADSQVAERLYNRAMGYEHDDVELKVVSVGQGGGSVVEKVSVRKIYPPDTAAAIFWLKNRQRGKWRDRIDQDLTTNGESLKPMTDDQVDKIIATLRKNNETP